MTRISRQGIQTGSKCIVRGDVCLVKYVGDTEFASGMYNACGYSGVECCVVLCSVL